MQVVERPTGSFSFGAGFSSQDRFVLTASLSQTNLFGRGFGVNLSADISTGGQSNRFFLSLVDPYFLDTTWSLGLNFFLTELRFNDFENRRQGLSVSLGHNLNEDGTAQIGLRYGFSQREIRQSSAVNAAAVIFREILQGRESSSLAGVTLSMDTRDDRFSAVSGDVGTLSLEYAGIGGFTNFLRLEGRYAHYFGAPKWLFDRSTFVFATRFGYALPLNTLDDYDLSLAGVSQCGGGRCRGLGGLADIDDDLELPLSERYFLGGVGSLPLRGYRGRTVGPRRAILRRIDLNSTASFGIGGDFIPVGAQPRDDLARGTVVAVCSDRVSDLGNVNQGNLNGLCNDITDTKDSDFEDLDETDVIGGNSFIATSFEYRFPISREVGLQGVFFVDMGDAFAEGENLFDVTEWRYGYGAGVLWFSPFGPLQLVLGWPVDPLEIEDSPSSNFPWAVSVCSALPASEAHGSAPRGRSPRFPEPGSTPDSRTSDPRSATMTPRARLGKEDWRLDMRVDKALVVIAAVALFGWGLGASSDGVKIGVVDIEQAAISTDAGKSAKDELERKMREAQGKLQPLVEQYQELASEVESKKFVLSDEALREKQLDLVERQNRIQSMEREVKGQLKIDERRLIAPVLEKLNSVVSEIGRKEGFSVILQRGAPGVVYTREALDITDAVIEAFNKQG